MDVLLSAASREALFARGADVLFAASALHVAWLGAEGASRRPLVVTVAVLAVHLTMAGLFLARLPEGRPTRPTLWLPALPSLLLGAFVGVSTELHFSPLATWLFALGALGTLACMLTLGRSFGVLPGARRLVVRGPYRLLRHPMYASELVMFIALVLHLRVLLATGLVVLVGIALAWRITAEEQALATLPEHVDYVARVPHRLVPGVW